MKVLFYYTNGENLRLLLLTVKLGKVNFIFTLDYIKLQARERRKLLPKSLTQNTEYHFEEKVGSFGQLRSSVNGVVEFRPRNVNDK